ncbi:hypothetical protein JCGZ_21557 [Jatropha curcas]|uniref:Cathepsin propeptide inhibitor domain-containing protein n=1 Tax=Jatropha curcas TaxID=180498 RepID=A0A067JBA3_JATCU|nr:hypothetical protein JCGZ_21557 [Jatropha curcas]
MTKKQSKSIFLVFVLNILTIWATHTVCRPLNEEYMLKRHEEWRAQHGRVYKDTAEKQKKYLVFKDNLERIESFNNGVDRGYKLGLNKFADLTDEEFRAMHLGYKSLPSKLMATSKSRSFRYRNVTSVPTTIDWRKAGAVTLVKDQGSCGKC